MDGGSETLKLFNDNYTYDGLADSLIISNEAWDTDTIDEIRSGTYGAGGATPIEKTPSDTNEPYTDNISGNKKHLASLGDDWNAKHKFKEAA